MDLSQVHVPPSINFPRISEQGFVIAIFTFLAIAIVGAVVRIGLRIVRLRTFRLDDAFLLLALAALTATCVINKLLGDILYIQIYASLGLIEFPANLSSLLYDHQLLQSASVLGWVAIYAAKFSLLLFFRKLVARIRLLERLWLVVTCLVAVLACVDIPLGFMVCTDFSQSYILNCPANIIDAREKTYTDISTALDIIADLLILSIPIGLLWMVKISLKQKLALAAMLCLSVFMIIIAIVRVAGSLLPGDITDTVWLFFWQTMEAAVAVIIVALTGFRSLFHTDPVKQNRSGQGATYGSDHPLRPIMNTSDKYNQLNKSRDASLAQSESGFGI